MSHSHCCPSVQRAIENRHSPLEWNDELATCTLSFHDSGGYSILRFCPYCGHAFPIVAAVAKTMAETQEETNRILQELQGVVTLSDLTARLGPPVLSLTLHSEADEPLETDPAIRRHRYSVCDGKIEVRVREFHSGRIKYVVGPTLLRHTTDRDGGHE